MILYFQHHNVLRPMYIYEDLPSLLALHIQNQNVELESSTSMILVLMMIEKKMVRINQQYCCRKYFN
jgi:hypothetical protein